MSLPLSWKTEPLRSNCVKTPLTDPTKRPDATFVYVDVSSVSNEAFRIVETKTLLGKDAPSRARKQVKAEDIIFATVRPTLRRVALVPQELDGQVCSTGYCVIRTDRARLEPAFVYYWLLTGEVAKRVDSLQKGATYPAISDSDLLNECVPVPPLPEQRAIASALRAVQDARDARRRELTLERERKAALMEDLFTKGTRGEPCRETEMGPLPQSWTVVRFGSVFETQLGKMLSPKAKTGIGSRPYLRNANVQWGRVRLDDVSEMDFTETERKKFGLRCGDLLMCEGGEIGRTAIWNGEIEECYFQKAIHRLRPRNESVSPRFFLHFLEWAFRVVDLYGVVGTQTTIAHLPKEKLVAMFVPLPSIDDQRDVADVLTACDAKIAALEREAAVQDELFRTLLEELMTGRISTVPMIPVGLLPTV